jgi:hypothetical protein
LLLLGSFADGQATRLSPRGDACSLNAVPASWPSRLHGRAGLYIRAVLLARRLAKTPLFLNVESENLPMHQASVANTSVFTDRCLGNTVHLAASSAIERTMRGKLDILLCSAGPHSGHNGVTPAKKRRATIPHRSN